MTSRALRDAVGYHVLFLAAALPSAWLAPRLQPLALGLGLGYVAGLLLLSGLRGHVLWRSLLTFLAPLCVALLLPLWALVEVTQTLQFGFRTPHVPGAAVPLEMALLWLLPLFPVLLMGARRSWPSALLLALPVFALWEWAGPLTGLWRHRGVLHFHGIALAPLLAELAMAAAVLWAYQRCAGRGIDTGALGAVAVSVWFAGASLLSLLLVEYMFRSALLRIL